MSEHTAPLTVAVVTSQGAPVADAHVLVDGVNFGVTDQNGVVTGTVTVGSHTVSVAIGNTSQGSKQITVSALGATFTFTLPSFPWYYWLIGLGVLWLLFKR